jgi:putative transposase
MNNLAYKPFYRRHLPHLQPPGATLFITFRLAGSIPVEVLRLLEEEREQIEKRVASITDPNERRRADEERRRVFGKWDKVLDSEQSGPRWLQDERIAELVRDSLHHLDNQKYTLDAFCVMPNHVHLVCTPLRIGGENYHAIGSIMHSLKRFVALNANELLGRRGDFWQHENYDHVVRGEAEFNRIVAYVLNNPVSAGLVARPEDWKWSYCRTNL